MVNMGFIRQQFNSIKENVGEKAFTFVRVAAVVVALTLIPVPMEISAVEEQEESGKEAQSVLDTALQESEAAEEPEQEAPEKEESESASANGSKKESENPKETEPKTSVKDESESIKETEKETSGEVETSGKEETESAITTSPTEPESRETAPQEPESPKQREEETGSKENGEKHTSEKDVDTVKSFQEKMSSAVEIKVPIYNYDVVNIVAPAKYAVALNPYELAVRTGEEKVSTEQVVSRNYGILNKSSTDKIVSVTFVVEDLNGGEIVFVDSAEEAWEADEDTYAVYLAAVPADDSGIWIDGEPVDCDTTSADLSDVEMKGALDSALPLGEGENTISFRLSKAVYDFEDDRELILDEEEEEDGRSLELLSLASGEKGITAFSFTGAMNRKADWGKLLYGIKISAIYTYETATGEEEIVEGTGAMVGEEKNQD